MELFIFMSCGDEEFIFVVDADLTVLDCFVE
jgi:hypothetical protein